MLATAASPQSAGNGEIPHIWGQARHYTWTGLISNPESVKATINGNILPYDTETYRLYKGMLHLTIPLTRGEESLIVIHDGNDELFRGYVLSNSASAADFVPEEFEFAPFHTGEKEAPCESCHEFNIRKSEMLPGGRSGAVCYPCHKRDFPASRVSGHRAAGIDWNCMKCHSTEHLESPLKEGLTVKFSVPAGDESASLCYSCHKDLEQKIAGYDYVHGPVSMSACDACHDPHGADRKGLIKGDIVTICVECHGMEDILQQAVIHKPIKEKGCTACHNPHGNNYSYMLDADINTVCRNCHSAVKENNHPVNGHPTFRQGARGDEDSAFMCTNCHNPHSSEYRYLISKAEVSEFCKTCHR